MSYNLLLLLKKIPDDIIREYIIPYAYNTQSPELCADINSFYNTYNNICNNYELVYGLGEDSKYWLDNDICRFLNNDFPTMYGYKIFYINLYRRIYMNHGKSRDTIIKSIQKTKANLYKNYIKNHVCLLTQKERLQLKKFLIQTLNI